MLKGIVTCLVEPCPDRPVGWRTARQTALASARVSIWRLGWSAYTAILLHHQTNGKERRRFLPCLKRVGIRAARLMKRVSDGARPKGVNKQIL